MVAPEDKSISTGFLEAWEEDYEKRRIIVRDKLWNEFFEKHFPLEL